MSATPDRIGPWEDGVLYRGQVVAEAYGITWSRWLTRRSEGLSTPKATRVGRRLFYLGEHLRAWQEGRDGEPPHPGRPPSVLSADQVRRVRAALASGESLSAIGRRFGVSATAVRHIRDRRSWRWLS